MPDTISWLHISDIHFHPRTEWRDGDSKRDLISHLSDTFRRNESLRPDLIFCTGDIAFGNSQSSSLSSQYSAAKNFFDELLVVCGSGGRALAKDRLYLVPGNHDVNRESINTDAQKTLEALAAESASHVDEINQRFNDLSISFKDAIRRLDEYAKFVLEYLPHQVDMDGRQQFSRLIEINGHKLGIAGFNSAWTCAGDEDDRNIWLAENWQFNAAKAAVEKSDIKIGLIHHPVDWLNETERDIATRRISTDFDFWLHGHTHNAWVMPSDSHVVIAAGAIGAKNSEEFGVNITTLNFELSLGTAYLYRKAKGQSGWTIAPVASHAPEGHWGFSLPKNVRKTYNRAPLTVTSMGIDAAIDITVSRWELADRELNKRLATALTAFKSQPNAWITPILSSQSELAKGTKDGTKVNLDEFLLNPKSTQIKAPPQYGLTSLARYLAREAWRQKKQFCGCISMLGN